MQSAHEVPVDEGAGGACVRDVASVHRYRVIAELAATRRS